MFGRLVEFHLEFASAEPDIIRVLDRELDADGREVRLPGVFGLLNSTPFSVRRIGDPERGARILATRALASLSVARLEAVAPRRSAGKG